MKTLCDHVHAHLLGVQEDGLGGSFPIYNCVACDSTVSGEYFRTHYLLPAWEEGQRVLLPVYRKERRKKPR